jgi:hypothetical protein
MDEEIHCEKAAVVLDVEWKRHGPAVGVLAELGFG